MTRAFVDARPSVAPEVLACDECSRPVPPRAGYYRVTCAHVRPDVLDNGKVTAVPCRGNAKARWSAVEHPSQFMARQHDVMSRDELWDLGPDEPAPVTQTCRTKTFAPTGCTCTYCSYHGFRP